MAGGYIGRILFVDLSNGTVKEESLDEVQYRTFLGGVGLGGAILYQRQKAKVDPLGPDNLLGFVTGLLTGTPVPSASRYMVVTKSPLTGCWGDANSGGYFGRELKASGYDAIFFSGISPKPVFLFINDGKVEIRDAVHLWGKTTVETEIRLKQELGDQTIKVACIGIAGERLSLIGCVINDGGRAAARAGVGAVMGAKRLKAIAVKGKGGIPVAHPEQLRELRKTHLKEQREIPSFVWDLMEFGTCSLTESAIKAGATGIRNCSLSGSIAFPGADKLTGIAITKYQIKKYACFGCPIGCGGTVKVDEGPFAIGEVKKPEYETLAAFGAQCLNDNTEAIIKLNALCTHYGLDTISTGNTIAFAMECYEHGLLSKEDTDGIELTWGNDFAMIELVEKMAKREGFGAVLADGVKRASQRIGRGSEVYAMHIQGQEPGACSPKYSPIRGLVYLVDPTPGRHTAGITSTRLEQGYTLGKYPELQPPKTDRYSYENKGKLAAIATSYYQALQASGMCLFPMYSGVLPLVEYINAVTGWDYTISELLTTGERIQTLRHAFNLREGFVSQSFRLPDRMAGRPPAVVGPAAGITVNEDRLKRDYYQAMDWDLHTGQPSPQKIVQLGLQDLLQDLYQPKKQE